MFEYALTEKPTQPTLVRSRVLVFSFLSFLLVGSRHDVYPLSTYWPTHLTGNQTLSSYFLHIFLLCLNAARIDSYRPISDTAMKDVWGRLSPRCQLYAHKTYTTGRGRGRKGVDCQCPTHWRLFLSLYTLLSCWLYRLMISTVPLYPISHSYVSRVVRSSIEMVGTIDHVPVDCPSYKGGKEKKKQIEVTSQKKKNSITKNHLGMTIDVEIVLNYFSVLLDISFFVWLSIYLVRVQNWWLLQLRHAIVCICVASVFGGRGTDRLLSGSYCLTLQLLSALYNNKKKWWL